MCSRCDDNVDISPRHLGLTQRRVTVRNLQAHTQYSFEIQAVNSVSNKSPYTPQFSTVNITTNQAGRCSFCLRWWMWNLKMQLHFKTKQKTVKENTLCLGSGYQLLACMWECVAYFLFEQGLRRKTVFWMGLGKGPLSNTHSVLSANTAANSNSEAECIHNVEPSVFQQPTASSPPLYQPTPDNIRVTRTF